MNELDLGYEFRTDGRLPSQIRSLKMEMGIAAFRNFDGSSHVKQGLSDILVYIEGPKSVRLLERRYLRN